MRFAELLIQYNGFLLIFSAFGFLISLFWYSLTEKAKRKKARNTKPSDKQVLDEKVFFNDFENLENPAVKDSLKPIFEKAPSYPTLNKDLKVNLGQDFKKLSLQNEIKISTNKSEPTTSIKSKKKKSGSDKEKSDEGDKVVQNLLSEIKKDIKNKKG